MCRISPVSDDWVDKGCHLHVIGVEVALRPDHLGGIVCKRVFASTPNWQVDAASKLVFEPLKDPTWRRKLNDTLEGAMRYMLGVSGQKQTRARGRLREFSELIRALRRLGSI